MESRPVQLWEAPLFIEWSADVWSPEEKADFMAYIALNPLAGAIVPGTSGVRKVRWSVAGRGKSYGVRVIYYFATANFPLYLIFGYAKTEKADLSAKDIKSLKEAVARIKKMWRVP
jgi:RelE toxin of RelE / RelB toxin-antitoxin system